MLAGGSKCRLCLGAIEARAQHGAPLTLPPLRYAPTHPLTPTGPLAPADDFKGNGNGYPGGKLFDPLGLSRGTAEQLKKYKENVSRGLRDWGGGGGVCACGWLAGG